jgi:hypothetical protein
MQVVLLSFAPRFLPYTLTVLATVLLAGLMAWQPASIPFAALPFVILAGLAVLGTSDVLQTRHAILRNYPISAHLRFMLEKIRPEMRQYFFEDEKHGLPFSRDKRAVVYQRAKNVLDKRPFGTQYDVYADGYEWLRHSIAPRPHGSAPFRIMIGGPDCALPYCASIFNISADTRCAHGKRLHLAVRALRVLNARRAHSIHRRDAAAVRRKARRLQALHRSSMGIPGHLQGHAHGQHLPGFHRHRW